MILNYEEFYNAIWGYMINETDVSFDYRENNDEFIKSLTFDLYKDYEKNNVNIAIYAKSLKYFFQNLFKYNPETFDNYEVNWGEIDD